MVRLKITESHKVVFSGFIGGDIIIVDVDPSLLVNLRYSHLNVNPPFYFREEGSCFMVDTREEDVFFNLKLKNGGVKGLLRLIFKNGEIKVYEGSKPMPFLAYNFNKLLEKKYKLWNL